MPICLQSHIHWTNVPLRSEHADIQYVFIFTVNAVYRSDIDSHQPFELNLKLKLKTYIDGCVQFSRILQKAVKINHFSQMQVDRMNSQRFETLVHYRNEVLNLLNVHFSFCVQTHRWLFKLTQYLFATGGRPNTKGSLIFNFLYMCFSVLIKDKREKIKDRNKGSFLLHGQTCWGTLLSITSFSGLGVTAADTGRVHEARQYSWFFPRGNNFIEWSNLLRGEFRMIQELLNVQLQQLQMYFSISCSASQRLQNSKC